MTMIINGTTASEFPDNELVRVLVRVLAQRGYKLRLSWVVVLLGLKPRYLDNCMDEVVPNRPIQAIKLVKDEYGMGLKDAKDLVMGLSPDKPHSMLFGTLEPALRFLRAWEDAGGLGYIDNVPA